MKQKISLGLLAAFVPVVSVWTFSSAAAVMTTPLGIAQKHPAVVLINMEHSRNMYFEAVDDYSDYTDDDGDGAPDGQLDQSYRPLFVYEGYFNSLVCYQYQNQRFEPSTKLASVNSSCNGLWHGNFLNYVSMSRLDLARNALYGGKRVIDNTSGTEPFTVLERAYIPQNAHAWAKVIDNASDLAKLTPYTQFTNDGEHRYIFASVTPLGESEPKIQVLKDTKLEIWQWLARERPVAGDVIESMDNALDITSELKSDASNLAQVDIRAYCELTLSQFKQHTLNGAIGANGNNPGILYFDVADPNGVIQQQCNQNNSLAAKGKIDATKPYVITVDTTLQTNPGDSIDYNRFRYYGFGPTRLTFKMNGGTSNDVIEHKMFEPTNSTTGSYAIYNKADFPTGWTFTAGSSTQVRWAMVQKTGTEGDLYELKARINGWGYCGSGDVAGQGLTDSGCKEEHLRWGVFKGSIPDNAINWTQWGNGKVRIYQLPRYSDQIDSFKARVAVCVVGSHDDYKHERCHGFPENATVPSYYKPEGLLQQYSRDYDTVFALMTGSYGKNKSGGILRQNALNFLDAYTQDANGDATGQFATNVTVVAHDGVTNYSEPSAIVSVLDKLKAVDFSKTATISLEGGNNNGYSGSGSYQYANCNFKIKSGSITPDVGFNEGQCVMWGNPLAEMLAEGVNYLAKGVTPSINANPAYNPTGAYIDHDGSNISIPDQSVTWRDPFDVEKVGECSKPYQLVLSSVLPSYDRYPQINIPNSNFNLENLSNEIWDHEFGGSKNVFVVNKANDKYLPEVLNKNSFYGIEGMLDEVSRDGTYYSASVAYYARTHKVSGFDSNNKQVVKTLAVALSTPFPDIQFDFDGQKITLIPFAKSVAGSAFNGNKVVVNSSQGQYQTPNQIVDFSIDDVQYNGGDLQKIVFRVNFDDTEQGRDLDQDTVVLYTAEKISNTQLEVKVQTINSSGTLIQHLGYLIHGTQGNDGAHLVVRDCDTDINNLDEYGWTTPSSTHILCSVNQEFSATDLNYYADSNLSSRPLFSGLPVAHRYVFTPATAANAVTKLKDPLWYAAKYGGFNDADVGADDTFESTDLWSKNSLQAEPLTYFKVGNGKGLKQQLDQALKATNQTNYKSQNVSLSVDPILIGNQFIVSRYQGETDDDNDWQGDVKFVNLADPSAAVDTADSAKDKLVNDTNRSIFTSVLTTGPNPTVEPVVFDDIHVPLSALNSVDMQSHTDLINYLRGDRRDEIKQPDCVAEDNDGDSDFCRHYRNRGSSVLGDIVNSIPAYLSAIPSMNNVHDSSYLSFKNYVSNTLARKPSVFVGANDGMLHAFDASTTASVDKNNELFAYIPKAVHSKLPLLAEQSYVNNHQFYVDERPTVQDAQRNNCTPSANPDGCWYSALVGGLGAGGKGLYALDVTDPAHFSKDQVLWDIDDTTPGFAQLGYTFSRPSIVKTMVKGAPRWVVVVGNGYYPTTSLTSTLFVIDLNDGTLLAKYVASTGMAKTGLSTPIAVDLFVNSDAEADPSVVGFNPDGLADFVYAGDLNGNVWRFNLTLLNDPSNYTGVQTGIANFVNVKYAKNSWAMTKLFVTHNDDNPVAPRPITIRPEVVFNVENRKPMIVFGTGQYFEAGDDTPNTTVVGVNRIYGIVDLFAAVDTSVNTPVVYANTTDLVENMIDATLYKPNGSTSQWTATRSITTSATNGLGVKKGWFITLKDPVAGYQGELIHQDIGVRLGGQLTVTSYIPSPNSQCGVDGYSWVYAIKPDSGTVDLNVFDQGASMADSKLSTVVNVVVDPQNNGQFEGRSYAADAQGMRVLDSSTEIYGRRAWRQLQ